MSLSPDKAVEITSTSSRPSRPHPRSRSRSTFSIEIDIKPTRKSATPHMAARPLPAASTASAVAASSSEVASAAGKDAITLEEGEDEGQEEEHNGEREGVHEILSVQRSAGMGDMYRVVLEEGGRKVQVCSGFLAVSRTVLGLEKGSRADLGEAESRSGGVHANKLRRSKGRLCIVEP